MTFTFDNGQEFSSTTSNISLDHVSNKHSGVYNGTPFPTYAPLRAAASPWIPVTVSRQKEISLDFVQAKLDELVNNKQDPIFRFRLHHTGDGESYYDVETITADPPPPGTLSGPDYAEGVRWNSNPVSLGFLSDGAYFDNVNSTSFRISINTSLDLPVSVTICFGTPFDMRYVAAGIERSMTVETFSIEINLSLAFDPAKKRVDALSWLAIYGQLIIDPNTSIVYYKGIPVLKVNFTTSEDLDFGGAFQKIMRGKIIEALRTPAPLTGRTLADKLNSYVNAWLLGGVIEGPDQCKVTDAHVDGHTLTINYTGPSFLPPEPPGWPAGIDFSQGALANIDHIVVRTKENRSFDSMLGYLSLTAGGASGGQGRTDVDGLKGSEANPLDGGQYLSFAFEPSDTIFSPNTPQDPQRTLQEIDNGTMEGFVWAFADQDGPQIAPRVMGYHTAANVPVYDALSRDFAICHRWFAPYPGPTFPNRFYELTGRLNRTPDGLWCTDNSAPLREFDYSSPKLPALTPTIFDYLPANVSWKYFEHGYCFLRLFADHTFDSANIVSFDDPENGFAAVARRGELPNVSFIDPHFIDLPPGANCDEPPSDIKAGQDLARRVVEAVVSSPQWDKTLLIITYDEHGGFYDHVSPPAAAKVAPELPATYGVRVPAFIISPWVKGGLWN